MAGKKAPKYVTPAIGNSATTWRALWDFAPKAHPGFRSRKFITRMVIASLAPFRAWESFRGKEKLKHAEIHPEPVFIIGHWRSGTTHLHNLMSLDPQFGYLTNVHSLFPHSFMYNRFVPWIAKVMMPGTRPMDSMKIGLHTPQEEELALMNMGPESYYHAWAFPDVAEIFYDRTIAFTKASDKESWSKRYLELLRKISLNHNSKRLLLKNPPNTARIPVLLELFPNAKFIHIHRDPVEVYASTEKLLTRVLPYFQFRVSPEGFMESHIITTYSRLMKAYLDHRSMIPEGQLVETNMAALGNYPMEELERIYASLGLKLGKESRERISTYASQKKGHRRSTYELPADLVDRIRNEWSFVPDDWYQ